MTIEPRTSREKGRQYLLAVGHVRPANLEELDALARAIKDPDFQGQFVPAMEIFQLRLRKLEEVASDGDGALNPP